MKTHQVQQKTERRISAALRLVFVAALLLGQIALAFFLSTELRQRAAIIYTVLELAAFGYAVRIYNRTDGTSYKFGWIFLVLTVPVVGLILYFLWNGDRQQKRLDLKKLPMLLHLFMVFAPVTSAASYARSPSFFHGHPYRASRPCRGSPGSAPCSWTW